MDLLKENKQKQRKVYLHDKCIIKVYGSVSLAQIEAHVKIMDKIKPGYIISYGRTMDETYLVCKLIEGQPCNILHHPVETIYKFCLDSILETYPYVHMDWSPSNIMYDGKQYHLVDWDNVGIYDIRLALLELDNDMSEYYKSEFHLFKENFADKFTSLRAPVLAISSPV